MPAFLLLNWPPMSGSRTPGSGPVAASRAARPPTGAIAASRVSGLSFHSTLKLSAPIAARNRVPPAEARNHAKSRILIPCNGNGLLCKAESRGFSTRRGRAGTLGRRTASLEHRLGVLAEQRRAAADLPARLGGEPFAGRVAEAAAKLRVLDIGEGLAGQPMLVERILVRLAQRRPEEARILRLAPRHVLVGPGADEALHDVEHMRPPFVTAGRAGHLTRPQIGIRRRRLQIGLGAVFRQQRHQILQVARAHAMGDEPAPVLRMTNARRVVGKFGGMPVGQPPQRHPPHDPIHDVLLGVLRYRLVDRHRDILPLAAALAMDQRGDDAGRQLLAGDVIGMPDLRRDRRRVVFEVGVGIVAAIHHDPAECQMDQVGALQVLPRPVIAKRGHPRGHQRRETRVERGAIQAQGFVERAATRIEQDVGAAEQAQQVLARRGVPWRLAQVEHHRLLVAVVVPEEQRAFETGLVFEERPDPPCGIALGRFDLDDFGAEPGQQQPGVFGALVGDLDHPQAGQHPRSGIAHHFARSGRQRAWRDHRLLRQDVLPSNGSGVCCHCEERSDEAISCGRARSARDCFAALAMTFMWKGYSRQ